LRTNALSINGTAEEPRTRLLSPGTEPTPKSVPMAASHAEKITGPSSAFSALLAASDPATIGKSLKIKGEVIGSESLYIDGDIEGDINLPGGRVTVGRDAQVSANFSARDVVVLGRIRGNINASDRVDIRSEGSLTGDVIAQRISIEDGAFFKGGIDIRKPGQGKDGMPAAAISNADSQKAAVAVQA
jgi:cytoskeletal protein CcmA (bactofilin family)